MLSRFISEDRRMAEGKEKAEAVLQALRDAGLVLRVQQHLTKAGAQLLRERRAGDAERIFDKLISRTPDDARVISLRAIARVQQGKRADALGDLDKALALAPRDAAILRRGAQIPRALGSQMTAMDRLVQAG